MLVLVMDGAGLEVAGGGGGELVYIKGTKIGLTTVWVVVCGAAGRIGEAFVDIEFIILGWKAVD